MEYVDLLKGELHDLVQPLSLKLTQLETRIEETEAELHELRALKNSLTSVVYKLDPSLAPPPQIKRNGGRGKNEGQISQAKLNEFMDWLNRNRDQINAGVGIYASGLLDDPDFTVIRNGSSISKALALFHERGILVIDSVGAGGRKNFKVV